MDTQTQQLISYIQQQLAAGVPQPAIKQALLQNNWDIQLVDQAFTTVNGFSAPTPQTPVAFSDPQPARPKNRIKAIILISSPFLIFILAVVMAIISGSVENESMATIFSALTTILGLLGFVMLVVGPVLGILTLKKK